MPLPKSLRATCRLLTAGALAAVVLVVPAIAQTPAPEGRMSMPAPQIRGPASVADMAERLLDAVVNISTTQNVSRRGPGRVPMPQLPEGSPFEEYFGEFFGDQDQQPQMPNPGSSLGSGFIVDAEEGIIVTNNHVITGADEIIVNFADGETRTAELIGVDTKTDIAVLKIDPQGKALQEVQFGDSEAMRIGDWVMAIGNPFGFGGSVTVGIVSAQNRQIGSGPYDDYIQTDAAINRGNSGGPLFNMDGEVIGINTAIISPTGGSIGIGFAIPSNLAVNVAGQLREFGETRRGWLGVRIQPVTEEIAESLGLDEASGVLISGIEKGGPADNGVLQAGDIIVGFDGRKIMDVRELRRIVAESPVGKKVDVEILRKGEEQTVQVELGRLEEGEDVASATEEESEESAPVATAKVLGMSIAELDEEGRSEFGLAEDINGVLVSEVEDGSVAADQGVQAGDVIVEIALQSVSAPQDVLDQIDSLKEQGRKNALLMLASPSGELRFVTLRMD
ncbi:DegQ family serine endoprotease [Chelativorans alearense]|uniref:DegQ family serine endoprotease n=1 Tax=Chelativorans alearense TaxID=2681495 RepID=UPI0013D69858|nr:DegQ family serine endoprotease [Chelativorans alearense]